MSESLPSIVFEKEMGEIFSVTAETELVWKSQKELEEEKVKEKEEIQNADVHL